MGFTTEVPLVRCLLSTKICASDYYHEEKVLARTIGIQKETWGYKVGLELRLDLFCARTVPSAGISAFLAGGY